MPKNHRKVAAAHARAAQWSAPTAEHSNSTLQATPTQTYSELQGQTSEPSKLSGRELSPIELDSKYECGYTGGVSCYWSDTGDKYETDSNADSKRSECDSLCKLEGSKLEENLRELREEVIALGTPVDSLFNKISKPKTGAVWKKAERNRSLGYNGLSGRTQRQRDKAARDQAEQQKKMKTLYV
ncbi:hypothetical protein BDR03DRAFT_1009681 [Suillus americanus]|nr:hypothetical protein BDR03DRAFT_1009681 [Suillus americanus]